MDLYHLSTLRPSIGVFSDEERLNSSSGGILSGVFSLLSISVRLSYVIVMQARRCKNKILFLSNLSAMEQCLLCFLHVFVLAAPILEAKKIVILSKQFGHCVYL
jgi:hypothetical protein